MYGNAVKCDTQLESDRNFFESCDSTFASREEACKYHLKRAWDFGYEDDMDTSIKRFNQAWMLDSLNPDVYWGFGIIEGARGHLEESLKHFNRSLELNPENANVWYCAGVSYKELYLKNNNEEFKDSMIKHFNKALEIDPQHHQAQGELNEFGDNDTGMYNEEIILGLDLSKEGLNME